MPRRNVHQQAVDGLEFRQQPLDEDVAVVAVADLQARTRHVAVDLDVLQRLAVGSYHRDVALEVHLGRALEFLGICDAQVADRHVVAGADAVVHDAPTLGAADLYLEFGSQLLKLDAYLKPFAVKLLVLGVGDEHLARDLEGVRVFRLLAATAVSYVLRIEINLEGGLLLVEDKVMGEGADWNLLRIEMQAEQVVNLLAFGKNKIAGDR